MLHLHELSEGISSLEPQTKGNQPSQTVMHLAGKLMANNTVKQDAMLVSRAALNRNRGPFKLTIALTWVCDQQCTHCKIWARPRSEELSAGEWRRVFRSGRHTLSWLDLTGGEVTTRRDFVEIAVAALEELPNLAMLHFPSNGRRPERLEAVVKGIRSAHPKRLIVSLSLDGPPDVHAKLRGDENGFDRTVESYKRLRSLGVETYFGLTVSAFNIGQVKNTLSALQERVPNIGWTDLHVNILQESDHYFGNTGIEKPAREAVKQVINRLVDERGIPLHPTLLMEQLYLKKVGQYLDTGRSPIPCTSLRGNAFIDPTGKVFPCHIWDKPIGTLIEYGYSLPRLWANQKRMDARKLVREDRCPGCWTPCEAYPSILSNLPSSLL